MLGQYLGAGASTTKLLLHLNGNSTDSSGNGNNGSDTNITYVPGKFGQCASFNGSSSYINVSTNLYALTDFTVCAWIKTTSSNNQEIYEQRNTADNADLDFSTYQGKVHISNWNGSTAADLASNASINDGNWHFIGATRQVSSATTKIYIDGNYDNQNTSANTVTIGTNTGQIGRHPSGSNYYDGSIDEVITENRAWSAKEFKKYYTMTKGRFGII